MDKSAALQIQHSSPIKVSTPTSTPQSLDDDDTSVVISIHVKMNRLTQEPEVLLFLDMSCDFDNLNGTKDSIIIDQDHQPTFGYCDYPFDRDHDYYDDYLDDNDNIDYEYCDTGCGFCGNCGTSAMY